MIMSKAERERGENLRAVVDALEGVPVTWGQDDCSAFPASWVAAITGREVLWPAYSTEEEAHRLIAESGGLTPLWEDVARDVGLIRRVDGEEPAMGDIGLIRTSYHDVLVGVVFARARVACWRHKEGVRRLWVRQSSIAAVWEVPL